MKAGAEKQNSKNVLLNSSEIIESFIKLLCLPKMNNEQSFRIKFKGMFRQYNGGKK
jgi:hypothetical protein